MSFPIPLSVIENLQRICADMAAHEAVARFRGHEIDEALLSRCCRAAAASAVETFASHVNSQLRLIELDHERRAERLLLHPLPMFVPAAPKDDK